MQVSEKLSQLRAAMASESIDAAIVGNTDPHNNEYVAPRWRCREWLAEMKGSNGTVVVTADWAGLWTDSRYYQSAEEALEGTGIELMRMSDIGVPSIAEWLKKNCKEGETVSFNGTNTCLKQAKAWIKTLKPAGLEIRSDIDFIEPLWTDRPAAPKGELYLVGDELTGQSIESKISAVREKMADEKVDAYLLGRTDESCWLLNFRGTDILNQPTPYCHTLVTTDEVMFFIDSDKLTDEATEKFTAAGITLRDYDEVEGVLEKLSSDTRLLIVPHYLNYQLAKASEQCIQIEGRPIATDLKAVKNATEVKHLKQSLIDDGAAMVRFYVWLYKSLKAGEKVTELSASKKLEACRAEVPGYRHVSFESIMGYGPDGALNHYSVDEESDKPVSLENIFLIDSGGNYAHGTTDTTRTIPMGEPTQEQKEDYTSVLSSMIELLILQFPEGTTGAQLDGVCRLNLWKQARNFKHGTGHGVGFGLEVHEGPQNISGVNAEHMKLGMITTIEPGCYRPGKHGIRIENMVHTVVSQETDFGRFFKFENLTFCPLNVDLIEPSLLPAEHTEWLNNYNAEVFEKLSPLLSEEETEWLKHECRAI
ncbi:aminopeptidase P family protein [Verrucomicrobiaceae bacterium 5K15]|uniref:Aminopeptidase P family protein n=1 Tax=Oceaniferula flava TaxID=2800421 RepID=A0AAE2VBQ4_9BACT|nr:aminopeptidase P family protein [Oceaniferula flavus]MBK1854096.1 aminopeptidase P family protein [Oceaniferula flavus]MBM1135402.1 aminopeptidase P family protein [Oceaniferula flavus]